MPIDSAEEKLGGKHKLPTPPEVYASITGV
jgi:hypothetical protein